MHDDNTLGNLIRELNECLALNNPYKTLYDFDEKSTIPRINSVVDTIKSMLYRDVLAVDHVLTYDEVNELRLGIQTIQKILNNRNELKRRLKI